jgi:hypothetical protein
MTDTGSLSAGGGETLPLSAVWFRHERERLAISRRVLAQRLQIPEGRIATLEKKQRSVPASWIKLLSELEFRIPLGYASSAEPEVPAQPEQPAAEQTGSLAEDTQAGAQAIPPARKQRFRRVDGRWLRAERERLGYSRQALQAHLKQVDADTYAFVEGRGLVIPASWRPVLRRLGFQFPTPESSPQPELLRRFGAPSSLNGEWLARERSRLGLSVSEVRSALRISWHVLVRTERRNFQIPEKWLPALRDLGMRVGPEMEESVSGVKEEAESSAPANAPPAIEKAAELVELILSYRLKFGRSTGQTPVEVLAWIAHDLRQSGAEAAISFDAVERAVRALRNPQAR